MVIRTYELAVQINIRHLIKMIVFIYFILQFILLFYELRSWRCNFINYINKYTDIKKEFNEQKNV